ncbi:uncharacterized protein MYCFIDRAFT_72164 [Pseudocercospora fijiensis CIRAD86]|uniref:Uncharacterized protein n=1 Tax=Pseudocercospora fijiensis (strain CIRAD86) TaxID=383855 RepID=M2YUB4_PSEFD|nr:uncharacterized protein MYCFIDRAFT_72164 [Pseudocercospora fijiensis CIRAD86]EME81310.1 hypothetical protein MYCFIDRAFT_72164 [Pseudocercospora fijiensis CIRAD86]
MHSEARYCTAYREQLAAFAAVSPSRALYSGSHLYDLCEFMTAKRTQSSEQAGLVTLCDFGEAGAQTTPLSSPEQFRDLVSRGHFDATPSSVLFLQGRPTAQWLENLGQAFGISCEFFNRHLEYQAYAGQPNPCAYPPLPSQCASMLQFRIFTVIKCIVDVQDSDDGENLRKARAKHSEQLKAYQSRLRRRDGCRGASSGQSVIRNSVLHDLQTMSVEQVVSAYVKSFNGGWISIVWSDVANDLHEIVAASWFGGSSRKNGCHMQTIPAILVPPDDLSEVTPRSTGSPSHSSNCLGQNIASLPFHCALGLDHKTARHDPFYALSALFSSASASQLQYINMLAQSTEQYLRKARLAEESEIWIENLLMIQKLMHSVQGNMQEIEDSVQQQQWLPWPSIDTEDFRLIKRVDEAKVKVTTDYKSLLRRTERIAARCESGLHNTMSSLSIAESKKGIEQAGRVAQLTRLAFVFVPLSFTTSFFGMNFQQLATGDLQIWVWFVISLPIVLLAMVYISPPARKSLQKLRNKIGRLRSKGAPFKEDTVV